MTFCTQKIHTAHAHMNENFCYTHTHIHKHTCKIYTNLQNTHYITTNKEKHDMQKIVFFIELYTRIRTHTQIHIND